MGCNQLVIIRTDANSNISSGHLMRCLSIADACVRLGMKVRFIVSDKESDGFVTSFSCQQDLDCDNTSQIFWKPSVEILSNADYQDLEQELSSLPDTLKKMISEEGCSYDTTVFLLDSYFVTPKYLKSLKEDIRTAYIDDLQLFDYPVDLVINYDVIPPEKQTVYEAAYRQSGKILLGLSYSPLRQQFQNVDYSVRSKANDVIVTTGGSDPYRICREIVQRFASGNHSMTNKIKDTALHTLHIIVGKYNEEREVLLELAKELPFLQLHENVTNMAALMSRCDLAISASGTTLYELCAVGVPTISFTMADNQLTAAHAFAKAGAIPCAGDVRTEKDQVIDNILSFMTEMSQSIDKRKSAHDAMSRLVDGKGAMRIAKALQEL